MMPSANRLGFPHADESSGRAQRFNVASEIELLPFLLGPPLGLSRKRAKDLLRFGAVSVAGRARLRHDTQLTVGEIVTISDELSLRATSAPAAFRLVHLDAAIVVIDKPAGLLAMGSAREKKRTAHRLLNEYLKASGKQRQQQAFIVHRLDRETSGLMIFARSEEIQSTLQHAWKNVTKRYLAVVEGSPPKAEGTLEDRLREGASLMVRRVHSGGELAVTHYRTIRRGRTRSLLELTLATGRKHQIRVQLAGVGCPVAGDRKYGTGFESASRLALHACELSLRHPISQAPMVFRSDLPTVLAKLLE
jgi:23S rRNA pseudouridine1911/1915/1917 synthase